MVYKVSNKFKDIKSFLNRIQLDVDIDWFDTWSIFEQLHQKWDDKLAEKEATLDKKRRLKMAKEIWEWGKEDLVVHKLDINPKTNRWKTYAKIIPRNLDEFIKELNVEGGSDEEDGLVDVRVKGKLLYFFSDMGISLNYKENRRKITAQDVLNLFSLLDRVVKNVKPDFVNVIDLRLDKPFPYPVRWISTEDELYEWVLDRYTAIKKSRVDKKLMERVMKEDKWWEDRGTHYVWINQKLKRMLEKAAERQK